MLSPFIAAELSKLTDLPLERIGVPYRVSHFQGAVDARLVRVELTLRGEDRPFVFREADVVLIAPNNENMSTPSLLGRDILRLFTLTVDFRSKAVTLDS
jgi:hypothetical protein